MRIVCIVVAAQPSPGKGESASTGSAAARQPAAGPPVQESAPARGSRRTPQRDVRARPAR